jgi:4-hydroxy-tetrahydrodipicolinate synthase
MVTHAAKEHAMSRIAWSGVYPASSTQFGPDLSVDLDATQQHYDRLIKDGVHGLIVLGTVGENNSLTADEKRAVVRAAVEVAAGRVPVLSGVSEFTTGAAADYARDAEKLGADGLMVLPAMVYVPTEDELVAHFDTVAGACGLPLMLYNNPPAYRVDISISALERLARHETVVALKEAAVDTRRYTDLINALGDRYVLFAGLDDVALEALALGADGWVSGLTNAFPAESLALWDAMQRGDLAEARRIYRWFMPLLHLDAEHDLVQAIKMCNVAVGRGNDRIRPPRLPLAGARRAGVEAVIRAALAARPLLEAA